MEKYLPCSHQDHQSVISYWSVANTFPPFRGILVENAIVFNGNYIRNAPKGFYALSSEACSGTDPVLSSCNLACNPSLSFSQSVQRTFAEINTDSRCFC